MIADRVIQLFYNDRAGSYSGPKIAALEQALRATGARVQLTPSFDSPPVIDPDATHICIAGGDGTVRHVAAALVHADRPLPVAIYPAGTINLLAREGGCERRPARLAAALLDDGMTRPHSPVQAGDTLFFACASVGPDSFVVASVSSALKRRIGRLAYAVTMARMLWTWPRHRIVLSGNGQSHPCEAVYIAKGRYYAGPWSFAPNAKVDDGKLHVVALKQARRRDYLRFCWLMLAGADPAGDGNVLAFSCTTLSLHSDCPLPLQGDGDIVAMAPVDIAIHATPVHIC